MEKELSQRKQKILQALIDEYITSAEPVSSGDIQTKYLPDVCSATVRSELATLEDMGYLVKPHISAGRIPSPMAYRLYVEKLMPEQGLTAKECDYIKQSIGEKVLGVEDIIKQTAQIISDVTNYTSVIVVKNFNDVKVSEIKLVPIGEDTALVIIITDNGVLKDKTIEVPEKLGSQYIQMANSIINRVFGGKSVGEILAPQGELEAELQQFRGVFEKVLEIIESYSAEGTDKVYTAGELKMLDYPECGNIDEAKNFLSVIHEKDKLVSLIDTGDNFEFSVKVGKDESGGLDKCAVVTARYSLNGKEIGQAGVIGPERMNYNKVLSVLNYISKAFDKLIDNKEDDKK